MSLELEQKKPWNVAMLRSSSHNRPCKWVAPVPKSVSSLAGLTQLIIICRKQRSWSIMQMLWWVDLQCPPSVCPWSRGYLLPLLFSCPSVLECPCTSLLSVPELFLPPRSRTGSRRPCTTWMLSCPSLSVGMHWRKMLRNPSPRSLCIQKLWN